MNYKQAFSALWLCLLLLPVLSACNNDQKEDKDDTPIYKTVKEGTLNPGDDIPAPADDEDIILTVTGKIGKPNRDNTIVMDQATIESLDNVEYTVNDPFLEKKITYRGVLMSDLLKLWDVPEDAKTLHVVALNDYAVDIPLSEFDKYPIFFALQMDGEYMPVSTRGPAMLVFPYENFEFDPEVYNSYWVWQISGMDVQ